MTRRVVVAAALLGIAPAIAAESLSAVARDEGFDVAWKRAQAIAADAGPKRRRAALESAGFGQMTMPVFLVIGAELVLDAPTDLGACAWTDTVTCRFEARPKIATRAEDYRAVCKTKFGSTVPLTTTPVPSTPDVVTFSVTGLETCWNLGGTAIKVMPAALSDLEGIGQGDDLIPPELAMLSQVEAERIIVDRESSFRYCTQRFADQGTPAKGTMSVAYTIGPDGTVSSATVDKATFADERVQGCILEQFERLRFPPPMGGYAGGLFPFTFL